MLLKITVLIAAYALISYMEEKGIICYKNKEF